MLAPSAASAARRQPTSRADVHRCTHWHGSLTRHLLGALGFCNSWQQGVPRLHRRWLVDIENMATALYQWTQRLQALQGPVPAAETWSSLSYGLEASDGYHSGSMNDSMALSHSAGCAHASSSEDIRQLIAGQPAHSSISICITDDAPRYASFEMCVWHVGTFQPIHRHGA